VGGLASVAASVVGDLLTPPLAVAFGFGVAAGAAMPKTAMHEDGHVVVEQYEVGFARQSMCLCGVADSETSHHGTHTTLGRGSLGCHTPHAL
jgi:hypothetical protein